MMGGRKFFLAGFAITVGMITWGDFSKCSSLPWPPRIVAAAMVFAILDLFSALSEELAGVIAIGIVLAAIVNKGFATDCQHSEATAQAYSDTMTPPSNTATV